MQLDLGVKIRQLRMRDNQTQEMVAQVLGVTAQAVSRWEAGGSYPDMNLIPSIANYFGVTIDELFGYQNRREQKILELVQQINRLKRMNHGEDVNISEAIDLARRALVEFPGNERLMLCLASVLYTAGYVRYGEYHLTDEEGYDVYDIQRHRGYGEWKEAIVLYEKALENFEDGDVRRIAVGELIQLYLNTGMYEKAMALAEAAPSIYSTREYMRICACDGKNRVLANGKAMLDMLHACAVMMVKGVLANGKNMALSEKIQSLYNAIRLFELVCTDGNFGEHHRLVARIYTLLSVYLWADGQQDEAFSALDHSLEQFRQFEALCTVENPVFTAPLVQQLKLDFSRCPIVDPAKPETTAASLSVAWPWWRTEEETLVKEALQADPRWAEWVRRTEER